MLGSIAASALASAVLMLFPLGTGSTGGAAGSTAGPGGVAQESERPHQIESRQPKANGPETDPKTLAFFAIPVGVAAVPLVARRPKSAAILRSVAAAALVVWKVLLAFVGLLYLPALGLMAVAAALAIAEFSASPNEYRA